MRPFLALAFGLSALVACADDGPTGPDRGLDVDGTWNETAVVVENECQGFEVPAVLESTFALEREGTRLIQRAEGLELVGTIDPIEGDFEIALADEDGRGFVQRGRFESSDRYVATSTFGLAEPGGVCFVRTEDVGTKISAP